MVESARIKRSLGHPSSSPRTSFNPPERSAPSVGHRGRHENGRGVFRVPSVCYYAALGQDWIHFVIHTHTLLSRGKKYYIFHKKWKEKLLERPAGRTALSSWSFRIRFPQLGKLSMSSAACVFECIDPQVVFSTTSTLGARQRSGTPRGF